MGGGKAAVGVADVGVVNPYIVMDFVGGGVEEVDLQISVLLGVVDEEKIAVVLEDPQGFPGQV